MDTISTWSLLVPTLPTENATARMRFRCTRQRAENDDQLLEQMGAVLDALCAHFASNGKSETGGRS
ncbi:hypothetical protein WJ70_05610 [Burkholderia ubonensis]|uniref:hypothetical protein n=1 Tax=Burkholderia ubonensis TaxID=101571 RepID=UPI00075CCD15|nr:hypothetical protein [Burkholderia ubonensis]KVN99127.1 hypothetical protein WJ70_05610 [Burkholderia ubonensis]